MHGCQKDKQFHHRSTFKLRRMSSWLLLCLSLASSIHGGALQPVPIQPPQASVSEGGTAVLQCSLTNGRIDDYHAFWFQQTPGNPPAFIMKLNADGRIEQSSEFDERFAGIRDTSANAYVLRIQEVRTEDSATYWCMAETDYFQIAVSGGGTQLSITGGKSVKEPSVTLLSNTSPKPSDDDSSIHALCLAEGFFPGLLEIKWSTAGKPISKELVTPGPLLLNKDGSYSTSSILNVPHDVLSSGTLTCSVHHESSGSKVEKSLELC